MSILCSMVGASFVTAAAEVIRSKKGVTAAGNAQVDTAQSKFGGASALFDGIDDNLTISGNLSQTGDFTIEFWFRTTTTAPQAQVLFALGNETSGRRVIYIGGNILYWNSYGSGAEDISHTGIATNTWYHVAAVRSGTTISLYLNGTASATTRTVSGTVGNANNVYIGTASDFASDYSGHIDEVRISNNARYTAGFTPSTTPFVNDANTLLLIHADGTDASTFFEDDNGSRAPKGISAIGNAQVDTAQSKFGGASALFDGTSDYLQIANAGLNFAGDFTIEFWARHAAINDQQVYFDFRSSTRDHIIFYLTSGNKLEYFDDGTYTGTTNIAANTWYHIALSRSGSALRLFINGTQEWNNTNSRSHTNSGTVFIGISYDFTSTNSMNGHIDEVRISNSARYTASFTAPTAPFVNDANTLLLIHADGTDGSTVFRDDNGTGRSQKGITALGNAQIDTAQSQFSGASALFDGTGDYLSLDANSDLNFGTNNWTIEFYYRITGSADQTIFANGGGSFDSNAWAIAVGASGTKLGLFSGNVASPYEVAIESLPSQSVWYHLAFVRNGNTISYYRDGVLKSSSTYTGSINWNYNNKTYVGYSAWNGVDASGWMDELRISNNARYTAGFTPSTTPFQNDANTLLLMHMDGTDASTVFTDDNGKTPT